MENDRKRAARTSSSEFDERGEQEDERTATMQADIDQEEMTKIAQENMEVEEEEQKEAHKEAEVCVPQAAEARGQDGESIVDESNGQRMPGTGIKHSEANFIYTRFRSDFLDKNLSVLLLPIMTLEQVRAYTGGPYDVCFVCSTEEAYVDFRAIDVVELCTKEELEIVTATLTQFCKGIAYMVTQLDFAEIDTFLTNNAGQTAAANKLFIENVKNCLQADKGVKVPCLQYSPDLKVGKIKAGAETTTDPYLLYVKSTIWWAHMQGQKLLPLNSMSSGSQDSSYSGLDYTSSGGSRCLSMTPPQSTITCEEDGCDVSRCSSVTMPEGL